MSPTCSSWQPLTCCLCLWIYLPCISHSNGITRHATGIWLPLHSAMFARCTHVVARTLFLSMGEYYPAVWTEHIVFIHSSTEGQPGCFHLLAATFQCHEAKHIFGASPPGLFYVLAPGSSAASKTALCHSDHACPPLIGHQASKGSDPLPPHLICIHTRTSEHTCVQARERLCPPGEWMACVTPGPHAPEITDEQGCL